MDSYFLKMISGNRAGELIPIRLGSSVLGRSSENDVSFSNDLQVSFKHCEIIAAPQACTIQDLESRNGTFVNEQRIAQGHDLKPGDIIRIGSTKLEFGTSAKTPPEPVVPAAVESSPTAVDSPIARQVDAYLQQSAKSKQMVATRSIIHSDIVRVHGNWDQEAAPVSWIEMLLAQKGNLYLLIDMGQVAMVDTEGQQETTNTLFDWLPFPASQATPRLFDLRNWLAWPSAVEQAWGKDALMVLSTRSSTDDLLAHLRNVLRGGTTDDFEPKAIQGICWPSVLRTLLEVEAVGVAKDYFRVVDALWIEGAKDPLTWEWIGKPIFLDPLCKSMGIRIRNPQEAKIEG
jgi:pSer/pThr/pTyr-binding forkhead associated (FHA) protein